MRFPNRRSIKKKHKARAVTRRKRGGGNGNKLRTTVQMYKNENNVTKQTNLLNNINSIPINKKEATELFINEIHTWSWSNNTTKTIQLLEKLLKAGADIGAVSTDILMKLHSPVVFEFLLSKGIDPRKTNDEGYSYIELLVHNLSKTKLDISKKYGYNPPNIILMESIEEENIDLIRELIDGKNEHEMQFGNPLFFAVKKQNKEIVQLLLEKGANAQRTITTLSPYGSLLHYLIYEIYSNENTVNLDILDTLLRYGKYSPDILGDTIIDVLKDVVHNTYAESESNKTMLIIELLIKYGANLKMPAHNLRIANDLHEDADKKYTLGQMINYTFTNIKLNSNNFIVDNVNPSDIVVKFGVELEICVKLNSLCVGIDISNVRTKSWIELFELYASHMFPKYAGIDVIRKKYGYVYVSESNKYDYSYIFDLTTFKLSPSLTGKIQYDRPFFTIDKSVQCGDYTNSYTISAENKERIHDTFHIELVSPILDSMSDLQELLEFIGLYRPECFVSNSSAGFHVNVSLMNKITGKQLALTRNFFNKFFYPEYKEWEKNIPSHSNEYAYRLINLETNGFNVYEKTAKDKYVAVYRKSPILYEFRIFGSNESIRVLLEYTQIVTNIMKKSYIESIKEHTNM